MGGGGGWNVCIKDGVYQTGTVCRGEGAWGKVCVCVLGEG